MASEQVELVRNAVETLIAGDVEGAIAYGHADVLVRTPISEYRGHEGFRDWWRDMNGQFDSFAIEPHDYIEDDDAVIVPMTLSGRGAGSGAEVSANIFVRYTVSNGLVSAIDTFFSLEDARTGPGRT